jgi:hypothetical protein
MSATITPAAVRITLTAARTIVARSNPRFAESRACVVACSSETALTTMTARKASEGCRGGFLSSRRRRMSAGPSATRSAYDWTPTCSSTTSENSAMSRRIARRADGFLRKRLGAAGKRPTNGCGPFAVPFGARCGPFAVFRPTNSREHERTRSPDVQRFRGYSPVFAAVRGSLTNRGAEIRTRDLTDPNGARYQAAPRPDAAPVSHTSHRHRAPASSSAHARTRTRT